MSILSSEQRAEILYLMSDVSKDALGFRDRTDYSGYSDEALKAQWDYYCDLVGKSIDEDAKRQALCTAKWEAHIASLMASGAPNKKTAIRWDIEAMECMMQWDTAGNEEPTPDIGYYCYKWGMSYSMEKVIGQALGIKFYFDKVYNGMVEID